MLTAVERKVARVGMRVTHVHAPHSRFGVVLVALARFATHSMHLRAFEAGAEAEAAGEAAAEPAEAVAVAEHRGLAPPPTDLRFRAAS